MLLAKQSILKNIEIKSWIGEDKWMKYRKKTLVVEAFQYDDSHEIPDWGADEFRKGTLFHLCVYPFALYVKTLDGDIRISVGDYIIKGVHGELYPCKPDVFEKTYEKADEE